MARKSVLAPKIIDLCADEKGKTQPEIIALTGGKVPTINTMLPAMILKGQIHRAGTRKNYRYFTHQAHADAYTETLPQLLADLAAIRKQRLHKYRADRYAKQRAARPATPKAPPKPKKQRTQAARPRRTRKAHGPALSRGHKLPLDRLPETATVTCPAHVQVQRIPHGEDQRFRFTPPPGWCGEFMRDWKKRTSTT